MERGARQISAGRRRHDRTAYRALGSGLHPSNFFLSVVCAASVIAGVEGAALADYRIRNDYGGSIHKYKLKYAAIRDRRTGSEAEPRARLRPNRNVFVNRELKQPPHSFRI